MHGVKSHWHIILKSNLSDFLCSNLRLLFIQNGWNLSWLQAYAVQVHQIRDQAMLFPLLGCHNANLYAEIAGKWRGSLLHLKVSHGVWYPFPFFASWTELTQPEVLFPVQRVRTQINARERSFFERQSARYPINRNPSSFVLSWV